MATVKRFLKLQGNSNMNRSEYDAYNYQIECESDKQKRLLKDQNLKSEILQKQNKDRKISLITKFIILPMLASIAFAIASIVFKLLVTGDSL